MASHVWIADFRAAERRRGLAETSVDKRAGIVRRWIDHVGDPFHRAVTWRDVDEFLDASSMRAAVSRYAAVSHLHAFYLWAMRAELAAGDPTALVVRPRVRPGLPRPAHDTDLALALTVADPITAAAITVAAYCGLRCVEIARLQWCDVGADAIRVRGKGGRERVLPLPAAVSDVLERLERPDEWVFPWRETDDVAPGRRVSHAINGLFRGIGSPTTAHQLRHWCATRALAATGDLAAVQDYLGHASPATTRIYAKLDPSRLRAVADAISLPVPVSVAA